MGDTTDRHKRLQQQMNPTTLNALRDKGCDLAAKQSVTSVFFAGSNEAAGHLKSVLIARGFTDVSSSHMIVDDCRSKWSIEAVRLLTLSLRAVNDLTDKCVDIAADVGVVYDGWYTETQ